MYYMYYVTMYYVHYGPLSRLSDYVIGACEWFPESGAV